MQFIASQKDLLGVLSDAHGIADKKAAMPVLHNVLLTAAGDSLRVAATDLYMALSSSVAAEVREAGSIALPAKDLFDRIKAMPAGPVQITVVDAQATVKAVGSPRRFTLSGMPGADFPELPRVVAESRSFTLPAAALSTLIARTFFSISDDTTRAHVNSVFFEWHSAGVRMVSTDGHRLSKADVATDAAVDLAAGHALIPQKAVAMLRKILDSLGKGDDVTFSVSGPNAFFAVGGMTFSVKMVDAQFPPYAQVIPSTCTRSARLPRLQFIDALRAVSLASSDRTGGVKLTQDDGVLKITSESPESGNGFDEVSADWTTLAERPSKGWDAVGFNAKYFLDVLNAIDEDEVELQLSGELDPSLVLPGSPMGRKEYSGVVMPMRI